MNQIKCKFKLLVYPPTPNIIKICCILSGMKHADRYNLPTMHYLNALSKNDTSKYEEKILITIVQK
jgi:hypothetical protein